MVKQELLSFVLGDINPRIKTMTVLCGQFFESHDIEIVHVIRLFVY